MLDITFQLDDRLGLGGDVTDEVLTALAGRDDPWRLLWGDRHFEARVVALTVTETAFGPALEPVAATVEARLEVLDDTDRGLGVMVGGITWKRIDDLRAAGPDDPVFQLRVDPDGSAHVQFGDGRHGRRPPLGAITIAGTYRVGGGEEDT